MADGLTLEVATPQGQSGNLSHEGGAYLFGYASAPAAAAISLTMPVRAAQYTQPALHPIFQMNLPEGFMLEQLRHRLAKVMVLDPMVLLALAGGQAPIGRLLLHSPALQLPVAKQARRKAPGGERLGELLAWDGAQDLFEELVDKYIMRAGVSGVQPKVLVPEAMGRGASKATAVTHELIVKSGRDEFPGLAANEFICMSIAKEAGLPVPEFHLSKNRQLFVMRRFDRTPEGAPIGFEDMAVLMGRGADRKYQGSYAEIAKAIRLFVSPQNVRQALKVLFDAVALSCIVGNGDAHLKNFGVLYSDPTADDCRLAPIFDIVNTTAYIPEDVLALELGGSKVFFASKLHLLGFAKLCDVADPRARIEVLLHATEKVLKREVEVAESIPEVAEAIRHRAGQFEKNMAK